MAAAAAVTGSLLLTVGCSSSNSSSGSTSGNTGSGTNWATASSQPVLVAARRVS
jgi:hypothetical protein